MFDLTGKNAVVTGATSVLGAAMCKGLAEAHANIALCARNVEKAEQLARQLRGYEVKAKVYQMDISVSGELELAASCIRQDFGAVDILLNCIGGNSPKATCAPPEKTFFDLSVEAMEDVVKLNFIGGAVLPSQVFGKLMCESECGGAIINISSMNYLRPLTNIPAYSAAKAAVSNFTQWLAVDLAKRYGDKIRVNAIAPGFFLTDQNRFLLIDRETQQMTERGQAIIDHTPMGRMGRPEDLISTVIWLCAVESRFVNGVVVPVDGGFSAYSGV